MSAYPQRKSKPSVSPYVLNRLKDADANCEVANGTGKSRKNKSPYLRNEPAANLSLDTDIEDCGHVDSETPEKHRTYTPPAYLVKSKSTFSRYSDRKHNIPVAEPGRAVDSQYNEPPPFDLNHFMDTDSECGTPEKPVARKRYG